MTNIEQDPPPSAQSGLKNGTLSYTKLGVGCLFIILLWANGATRIGGYIRMLNLSAVDASDWLKGILLYTVPNILFAVALPFVSIYSDRFRGKWGRRMPFIAATIPFLLVIPYYGVNSTSINERLFFHTPPEEAFLIVGFLTVFFQILNQWLSTFYGYFFNDVVPRTILARLITPLQIIGIAIGSGILFFSPLGVFATEMGWTTLAAISDYILRSGVTNWFTPVSITIYIIGLGVMCWVVEEGKYPEPPPYEGFAASVKTYCSECFAHRLHRLYFLANVGHTLIWAAGGFSIFWLIKTESMDWMHLMNVVFISLAMNLVLLYLGAELADRFHPLRVILPVTGLQIFFGILIVAFVFSRSLFSAETAKYFQITMFCVSSSLLGLRGAADSTLSMRLFPQEKYGQFYSANHLIRSIVQMVVGLLLGMSFFRGITNEVDGYSPFFLVLGLVFSIGYFFILFLLHREWLRLGGMMDFTPPQTIESSTAEG